MEVNRRRKGEEEGRKSEGEWLRNRGEEEGHYISDTGNQDTHWRRA